MSWGRRWFIPFLLAMLLAGAVHGQDVTVELEQFGVGSHVRLGSWAAIRVKLTNNLDSIVQARVQWEVPNADGDIGEYFRVVALAPNQPVTRWLYAWISPNVQQNQVWTVRVFEERDGRRRGELGLARISMSNASAGPAIVIEPTWGMIGVVGGTRGNLDAYEGNQSSGLYEVPVGAHEPTRVVSGLDPRELPDRWEGLECFETLVWTDASPLNLALDEADAVREWIRRGGHLVIVLSEVGNPWGIGEGSQHQLSDILPTKAPRKTEGVPVSDLTPILSKTDALVNDRYRMTVELFDVEQLDRYYEPFLAFPCPRKDGTHVPQPRPNSLDGKVFAVQRTLGFGRVTLIGLNVTDSQLRVLQKTGEMPQPDAFWNRILGRRIDTLTPGEVRTLEQNQRLRRVRPNENELGSGRLVSDAIGMQGQAATGLMLGVLLFSVYWVAAGPGGYALLRQLKQIRHSWLMYVGMAVLFTGVAWGGVSLIGNRHQGIQHLTVLDAIYRPLGQERPEEPQYQRASVWFSVGVSNYGRTQISIDSEKGQRDLLTSWSAPGSPGSGFPNVDRYDVPFTNPANYAIPARATESQLHARWMGAIDPKWGGLISTDPENPVKATYDPIYRTISLTGTLKHALPGTLRDVMIVYINPARTGLRRYMNVNSVEPANSAPLPNYGCSDGVGSWSRDQTIDLATTLKRTGTSPAIDNNLDNALKSKFHDNFRQEGMGADLNISVGRDQRVTYLEILSLYQMNEPPSYIDSNDSTVRFRRKLGRELDLSPWLTRPCLIVMGFLDGLSCPVPIRVDGEPPDRSTGTTMIRWIYPLPLELSEVPPEPR